MFYCYDVVCNHVCLFTSEAPIKQEVLAYMFSPARPRSSVCLCARLLKKACLDSDKMLRVDRCRDMDELIYF